MQLWEFHQYQEMQVYLGEFMLEIVLLEYINTWLLVSGLHHMCIYMRKEGIYILITSVF